jgi:hypothetical protein
VSGRIRRIDDNSVTSSGLESATFRLVASRLNRLRYRVPPNVGVDNIYYISVTKFFPDRLFGWWSVFLATDPEVPGSIPVAARFSE